MQQNGRFSLFGGKQTSSKSKGDQRELFIYGQQKRSGEKPGGAEPGDIVTINGRNYLRKLSIGAPNQSSAIESFFIREFYQCYANTPNTYLGTISKKSAEKLLVKAKFAEKMTRTHMQVPLLNEESYPDFLKTLKNDYKPRIKSAQIENTNRYLVFLSEMIDGYHDLGENITQIIARDGKVPKHIVHGDKSYPIKGLMKAAAVAKVINDWDWLGSTGRNTGFKIIGSEQQAYVKTMVVDAGFAGRKIEEADNNQNIICNANKTIIIYFNQLNQKEKHEFLSTLHELLKLNPENIKTRIEQYSYFIHKNVRTPLFTIEKSDEVISNILYNIETLKESYKSELQSLQFFKNLNEEKKNLNLNASSDIGSPPSNNSRRSINNLDLKDWVIIPPDEKNDCESNNQPPSLNQWSIGL